MVDAEAPQEYLQRFGYRQYSGVRTGRLKRIWHLIWFEVSSTWKRSTFGKVLLIITIVVNLIGVIVIAQIGQIQGTTTSQLRGLMDQLVANYFTFGDTPIRPSTTNTSFSFSISIGVLLVALFGIAGSGLFADDKEGKVIEIYLSRMNKNEYIAGKIGAIILYINLFLALPLLLIGALTAQAFQFNHFKILDFYLGILLFSFITSLIIGMFTLVLSSLVNKRTYAGLAFFLFYLLSSLLGGEVFNNDRSNEFYLLISPSFFFVLLAYICLGHLSLGLSFSTFFNISPTNTPLNLNDGHGLEYYHVLLLALAYLIILGSILWYRIHKLTTEEV